jgi:hypothetical protein
MSDPTPASPPASNQIPDDGDKETERVAKLLAALRKGGEIVTGAEAEKSGLKIVRAGESTPDEQNPALASFRKDLEDFGKQNQGTNSAVAKDAEALQQGMREGFASPEQGRELTRKLQEDLAKDANNSGLGSAQRQVEAKLTEDVKVLLKTFDRAGISEPTEVASGTLPAPHAVPSTAKGTGGPALPD